MSIKPIHTSRLIIRPWQESDHAPFIAMNMDPEVMRYFPALQTAEETRAQIRRLEDFIEENGYGPCPVERRDTGEFIGYVGLWKPRFESFFTPCVEVGWRLDKAHWGQGFAQEAARAWLDIGFDQHGLEEIFSFTSALNLPSINVMKKIGMKEISEFEHPDLAEGDMLKKHVLYLIRESEWKPEK